MKTLESELRSAGDEIARIARTMPDQVWKKKRYPRMSRLVAPVVAGLAVLVLLGVPALLFNNPANDVADVVPSQVNESRAIHAMYVLLADNGGGPASLIRASGSVEEEDMEHMVVGFGEGTITVTDERTGEVTVVLREAELVAINGATGHVYRSVDTDEPYAVRWFDTSKPGVTLEVVVMGSGSSVEDLMQSATAWRSDNIDFAPGAFPAND